MVGIARWGLQIRNALTKAISSHVRFSAGDEGVRSRSHAQTLPEEDGKDTNLDVLLNYAKDEIKRGVIKACKFRRILSVYSNVHAAH